MPPRDSDTASSSLNASSSSTTAAAKETKAAAPVENKIPLTIEVRFPIIPPMTVDQKKKSRSRFVKLRSIISQTRVLISILDFALLMPKSLPKTVAKRQEIPSKATFIDYATF